jgi:hypothetical protein
MGMELDKKKQEANKFMVDSLMKQMDDITVEYDRTFISNMNWLVSRGLELTTNQQKYLEECFHHKY